MISMRSVQRQTEINVALFCSSNSALKYYVHNLAVKIIIAVKSLYADMYLGPLPVPVPSLELQRHAKLPVQKCNAVWWV